MALVQVKRTFCSNLSPCNSPQRAKFTVIYSVFCTSSTPIWNPKIRKSVPPPPTPPPFHLPANFQAFEPLSVICTAPPSPTPEENYYSQTHHVKTYLLQLLLGCYGHFISEPSGCSIAKHSSKTGPSHSPTPSFPSSPFSRGGKLNSQTHMKTDLLQLLLGCLGLDYVWFC